VLGHLALVLVVTLLAGLSLYMVITVVASWLSTKAAPRVDMFLCDIHGPIPREGVIKFMDMDTCGICFHERMRKAEKGQF
jgi:hypothetical protein